MQKWKILLLGITGDLSKRKVLPAIGQFADLTKDQLKIDLVGYSRSAPNSEEIKNILDSNSSSNTNSLNSITFQQGEYNDPNFFIKTVEELKQDEKLVVYLATPPMTFLNILETFCPYGNKNLHIVMEKPFGENIEDAAKLITKINECKLNSNVHFFDHYLFKTASILDTNVLSKLSSKIDSSKLKKIVIKGLEDMGLEGRAGYYEGVGALKDFFPSHSISLLKIGLKALGLNTNLENVEITKYLRGQYQSYLNDLENNSSDTETYFNVKGKLGSIELEFESGKKLGDKNTSMEFYFESGEVLVWNIHPDKVIKSEKLSLDESLAKNKNLDHTNMFFDVFEDNFSRFLNEEEVLTGWRIYNSVEAKKDQLIIYRDDIYPIEEVKR